MMFEQTFKNLDDIMLQEAGCNSELDYTEQTSWMLFLKYLDDLEGEREIEAKIEGRTHSPLFEDKFRWKSWAMDETKIADDLIDFVNLELMPYLLSLIHISEPTRPY